MSGPASDLPRHSWPENPVPQAQETTPLLTRVPTASGSHEQPVQVRGRNWRGSLPHIFRLREDALDDDEDAVDVNLLRTNRARLSSISSFPSVEDEEERRERKQRQQEQLRVESAVGEGLGQIRPEVATEQEGPSAPKPDIDDDEDPESKYIGISPVRFWFTFGTILLGYFVACFDTTLMASSHPVITSYFDAAKSASWLSTVFMITSTGFQPLFGRLSDTIGRKSVYIFVLVVFALTNMWCGLSRSIGSFIAARAVCGLGAGGTMSLGLIILNDLVRVEYRGTFVSHINLAFGLGSACGAAFGGVLCDSIGWRWAFGIQVPFILVCAIAAFFTTPSGLGPMLIKDRVEKEPVVQSDGQTIHKFENAAWTSFKNFDSVGVILLLATVTCLIVALNTGGNIFPWVSAPVLTTLIVSFFTAAALIFVERRAKQPVMPLHLLIKPPVANLVFTNLLAGIASNTVLFNVPLWFQAVKLSSPTASGLRLAVPSVTGSIAGIATGYIITYSRRLKPLLVVGAVVYVAGSVAISLISKYSSEAVSIVLITGAPTAQGFIYPATMMSAFAICEKAEQAVVTTTISLYRNLGIVLGVAISSLVFQNVLRINLEDKVQGPERQRIIELARSSVKSIRYLEPPYQGQVMESYAIALKLSFVVAVVASVAMLALVVPAKLPRLRKGKKVEVGAPE